MYKGTDLSKSLDGNLVPYRSGSSQRLYRAGIRGKKTKPSIFDDWKLEGGKDEIAKWGADRNLRRRVVGFIMSWWRQAENQGRCRRSSNSHPRWMSVTGRQHWRSGRRDAPRAPADTTSSPAVLETCVVVTRAESWTVIGRRIASVWASVTIVRGLRSIVT